jgi:hypothetical protein
MALVKVIASNLFGASGQKLAVGTEMTVSEKLAERWEKTGLVEVIAKQEFEVATPSGDAPAEAEAEAEAEAPRRGRKPKSKD